MDHFVAIILIFLSFSAQAKEGFGTYEPDVFSMRFECNPSQNIERKFGKLGGLKECKNLSPITPADLNCWDARSESNLDRVAKPGYDLEGMATDLFFRELAANTLAQAKCHANATSAFLANKNGARKLLDDPAAKAYGKIHEKLAKHLKEKTEIERKMKQLMSPTNMAGGGASIHVAEKNREGLRHQLAKVEATIAVEILSVPMGFDPDVAQSTLEMVSNGGWNSATYAQGVQRSGKKYLETVKHLERASKDDCLDSYFRNHAYSSGETAAWLNTLPASDAGERRLKDRLNCRLHATYRGFKRLDAAANIFAWGSIAFPAARAAFAVRGYKTAAAGVGASLQGANALWTVMAVQGVRRHCLGDSYLISADKSNCDTNNQLKVYVAQASRNRCLMYAASIPLLGAPKAKEKFAPAVKTYWESFKTRVKQAVSR